MQLKTKVITSLFIFFMLFSCKEERGYDVINILSDSNNPTEQDIDSELGKRFSRSREDIETFNFYYSDPNELEKIVEDYDISIIKFRGLANYKKFSYLNRELPKNVVSFISGNYPQKIIELLDQNSLSGVIPYEVVPTYLYTKETNSGLTFDIKDDIQLLDLLDLYRYYLYKDEKLVDILNQFKSDFDDGKFYDSNFNAMLSNENAFLSKFKNQTSVFNITEEILFIDMNGYLSVDKNYSDYFQDFLMHLTSFSSGDYLYRRANVIPLIKGYKVNKLPTNKQIIYKRIQSDNEVYIFSTSLMNQELKHKEVTLLNSFLFEEITIKEYLNLSNFI